MRKRSVNIRVDEDLEKTLKEFARNNNLAITRASKEMANFFKDFKGKKIREVKF